MKNKKALIPSSTGQFFPLVRKFPLIWRSSITGIILIKGGVLVSEMGSEHNKLPCVQVGKRSRLQKPTKYLIRHWVTCSPLRWCTPSQFHAYSSFLLLIWVMGNVWFNGNECMNNIIHQCSNFTMVKCQIYLWSIQVRQISTVIQLAILFLAISLRTRKPYIFISEQALFLRRWGKF